MRASSFLVLALLTAGPAAAGGDLFATTTSYEVFGGTARISLDPPYGSTLDAYQIHSDAVVRNYLRRWVFIVNRLYADNILVLDRDSGYGVVTQYSVASTGLNPRDIHVAPSAGPGSAPGRAFVTLYESNSLLVCDALSGANPNTIDLSAFADGDGLCEMDQMLAVPATPAHPEGLLLVTLQNQDRGGAIWVPTQDARIVLVDVATESLVDADPMTPAIDGIDLQLTNPAWRIQRALVNGNWRALVNCPGQYGVADGGIEIVDWEAGQSEGVLIDESTLGGDVLDFALLGTTEGWAILSDTSFRTSLVRFDAVSATLGDLVLASPGFDLADIELSLDERLFVADRASANPGVRIYDAATGNLLAGPLDTGLPPFDITLLDEIPVSAPALRVAARLRAAPNPFNPRVVITLEGEDAPRESRLEILDLRGRRLRTLDGSARWVWDGTDADGLPLPSGTYLARLPGSGAGAVKLSLVR